MSSNKKGDQTVFIDEEPERTPTPYPGLVSAHPKVGDIVNTPAPAVPPPVEKVQGKAKRTTDPTILLLAKIDRELAKLDDATVKAVLAFLNAKHGGKS